MTSAIAPVASVIGGVTGLMGANDQNEASVEAAEASRDIPDWLAPYYLGTGTNNSSSQIPINYNWLDTMNSVASSGMPESVPSMNMNNPMMTFENVYTPTEGGPWGQGLGPGQLTTEVGIPNAPGSQFIPQPEGFTPGPTGVGTQQAPVTEGGLMSDEMLDLARRYQRATKGSGMGEADFNTGPVGSLDALQWAQNNSGASDLDIINQGLLAQYRNQF